MIEVSDVIFLLLDVKTIFNVETIACNICIATLNLSKLFKVPIF